jgi:large subunit ribosomal protein L17
MIINGQLETTHAKAKELSRHMDKLITLGKKGTLASRRQAARKLRNVRNDDGLTALQLLFGPITKLNENRNGGYTRVLKTGTRKGDSAMMALVLFTK